MKRKLKEIVIYQNKEGSIELKSDFCKETAWARLDQMALLFGLSAF